MKKEKKSRLLIQSMLPIVMFESFFDAVQFIWFSSIRFKYASSCRKVEKEKEEKKIEGTLTESADWPI